MCSVPTPVCSHEEAGQRLNVPAPSSNCVILFSLAFTHSQLSGLELRHSEFGILEKFTLDTNLDTVCVPSSLMKSPLFQEKDKKKCCSTFTLERMKDKYCPMKKSSLF